LMQTATPPGQMVSLATSEARAAAAIAPHAERLALAAVNAPESVVISGDATAMRAVVEELQQEGVETRLLPISIASHSPLMEPILDELEQVAASLSYGSQQIAVVSGTTGLEVGPTDIATAE